MVTAANQLDLSMLPAAARREVQDFYQFILERHGQIKKPRMVKKNSSLFSDICGGLSWNGDAVATQRSIRDEW